MLIGLDPRLTPELLYHLARLGHGDEVALVDRNFPAYSTGREVPVVELPGLDAPTVAAMVLRLLPIDTFVPDAGFRMEVVGDPARIEPVQQRVAAHYERAAGRALVPLERFAFYDRAARARLILRSGELRFYGCFLFVVGVVPPEDAARDQG